MNRLIACVATACVAATAYAEQPSQRPLMKDFMGINAHTIQFRPELYRPLARLVRDYHPIDWDMNDDSSLDTTFPLARKSIKWRDRSGNFRDFSGQVNWHDLYGSWREHGFVIDACLVLGDFTYSKWKNPAEDAYRYGRSVAQYFGPSGEQKLLEAVEIGNEPAGKKRFSDEEYMTIFTNMARGIREADPALKILTCTVMADPPDAWSKSLELFKDHGELYDVINVHQYAILKPWPTFQRSFPEDARLKHVEELHRAISWRDAHAPGKEIWLTEFGYDATTQPLPTTGPYTRWKGVTDEQQAQWIVRSFLLYSAMDLERAYLYWFNDHDVPGQHSAAGVTRHYQPKMSYWAMRDLYQTLSDYRFNSAVRQDDVYVYEYLHGGDAANRIWVAWLPTGQQKQRQVKLPLPASPKRVHRMPMAEGPAPEVTFSTDAANPENSSFELSESPLYIHFRVR